MRKKLSKKTNNYKKTNFAKHTLALSWAWSASGWRVSSMLDLVAASICRKRRSQWLMWKLIWSTLESMLTAKKPNFVSLLVGDDLGSNDARKVSGGFHQQVDIDTGAVGTSQLGEGEQKLQGWGLKRGHYYVGLVPCLLKYILSECLNVWMQKNIWDTVDHNDPSKPSHRLTNGPEPSKSIESDGSNIKKPS